MHGTTTMTLEIAGLGNCSCCSQECFSAGHLEASHQEVVGGTISDVQRWPVGGIGQGQFSIDCHGCAGLHSEEETEPRG